MTDPANKILMITWKDAAYTFDEEFPDHLPEIDTTIGFLIEDNPDFIKIANNAFTDERSGKVLPIDGFIIPKRTILRIQTLNL